MLANASTVRDYQQSPNLHLNRLCWWHHPMDFHLVAFVFISVLVPFRNLTLSLGAFTLDEICCGSDRGWAVGCVKGVHAQSWRATLQLGFLSYQADKASTWDQTVLWWKHFLPFRTGLDWTPLVCLRLCPCLSCSWMNRLNLPMNLHCFVAVHWRVTYFPLCASPHRGSVEPVLMRCPEDDDHPGRLSNSDQHCDHPAVGMEQRHLRWWPQAQVPLLPGAEEHLRVSEVRRVMNTLGSSVTRWSDVLLHAKPSLFTFFYFSL